MVCWEQKVWCGIAFNSREGGGVWGYSSPEIFVFFYPYDCNSLHFLKQIFGYTALHYAVDRLNLQLSTCIVCLCRYHNLAITQGASLINLEGPLLPQSATMVGTERKKFENFASTNCRKWHFQSLLFLFC
jgi:hypothetical protein